MSGTTLEALMMEKEQLSHDTLLLQDEMNYLLGRRKIDISDLPIHEDQVEDDIIGDGQGNITIGIAELEALELEEEEVVVLVGGNLTYKC
jgi:hypothetical protein